MINKPIKSRGGITIILILLFICKVFAQGKFNIEGTISDVLEFSQILNEASSRSTVIDSLIQEIYAHSQYTRVVIKVHSQGVVEPATQLTETIGSVIIKCDNPYIDSTKHIKIQCLQFDLGTLRKFPHFQLTGSNNHNYKLTHGKPWAISIESIIAHELAEYLNGINNSYTFKWSRDHPVGIKVENLLRKEFGQIETKGFDRYGEFILPSGNKIYGAIFLIGPHIEIWEFSGSKFVQIHYVD